MRTDMVKEIKSSWRDRLVLCYKCNDEGNIIQTKYDFHFVYKSENNYRSCNDRIFSWRVKSVILHT